MTLSDRTAFRSGRSLAGKHALVTGGAKRIGRAVAIALAREGADISLHYHTSRDAAEALVEDLREFGVQAHAFDADLSQPEQVETLFPRAVDGARPLDILVNSASIFHESRISDARLSEIVDNMQINALAPMELGRRFAAQERPGHIVNFLDTRIVDYDHAHFAYHLSKRLLHTLTRIMALEFAPRVQVNAVAPGLVLPPAGKDQSYLAGLAHTNPLNRYGSVDELVAAVLFLLRTDFVTGQIIYVDGGRHMKGNVYG